MSDDIGMSVFYFTEYDKEITGSSKRDPLGLQPIWSYYGRKLIKHLTTISVDIRGFREVVLCLSICNECHKNQNTKRPFTISEMILLFEQLFIYSTIRKGRSDGIIGNENGAKRYYDTKEDTVVSFDKTILASEVTLGYYGRYKTPLFSMGIIDSYNRISKGIETRKLYGEELYQSVLKGFQEYLGKINEKQSGLPLKEFKAEDCLFEAVCGKFRAEEESFWLDWLQIEGQRKDDLMNQCYMIVDQNNVGKIAVDLLPKTTEVNDVSRVEPFLRCLEYVFYSALKVRSVDDIILDETMKEEHIKRYKEFCNVSSPEELNTILSERISYLKSNCDPASPDYIVNVLNYHKEVCRQKNSSVWVEYDTNKEIQAYMQPDTLVDIDTWGRDYYFASLWGIKKQIEVLKND